MMRKILLAGGLISILSTSVSAQDFTLSHDTTMLNTMGVAPPQNWDNDAIIMHNYLHNNTDSAITFQWQIIQNSLPFGWSLYGFCDNITCRPPGHPAIVSNVQQESFAVAVGDSSQLEPRFAIPSDADNGTGILRVRAWHGTFSDTAVYIITKQGTSVSAINLHDKRVSIYPNPSDNKISVYSEKSLNVSKISILNIVGREEFSTIANKGNEITEININSLAKGMYMMHLTDATGKIVTSRKFVKN